MKKVMVFNFRTMQFEQATEAEGKEWLSLIEANNAECAAQHHMHLTGLRCPVHGLKMVDGYCPSLTCLYSPPRK